MAVIEPSSVDDVIARWRRGGPIGAEHIEALVAEVERLREALGMLTFETQQFLTEADYTVEEAREEILLGVLHDAETILDG